MRSRLLALVAILSAIAPAAWQAQDAAPKTAPKVGSSAPSIRLNDEGGHAVAIGGRSEQWTLLAFFPKAATPG